MPSPLKLTIAGSPSLHKGIHLATVRLNSVELVFSKNGEVIARASLAANRTSLHSTLVMTQEKIALFCDRLGVKEQQLDYDRSKLPHIDKLKYNILFLKKMLFEAFIPVQWAIVYKDLRGNLNNNGNSKWHTIIPDSKVFQTDPFVVFNHDKYYVFYEELKFKDYHGYLMVAELDLDNKKLINEQVILSSRHHLSFPNVFKEGDTYYMIPESGDSNCVDLYECTDFPYQWEKKQTLIKNIKAVDTTPLKTDEGWYLFTTVITKGADCNDELSIYKSADLFNQPFTKLYNEPVITDVTNARMAGHFIKRDGELFRVSQNCGKRYGYQVNVNKVLQIEGIYKEEFVETLQPDFGALGFHTYNKDHDIIVGDMEIARFDAYSLKRFVWGNIRKHIFKM